MFDCKDDTRIKSEPLPQSPDREIWREARSVRPARDELLLGYITVMLIALWALPCSFIFANLVDRVDKDGGCV